MWLEKELFVVFINAICERNIGDGGILREKAGVSLNELFINMLKTSIRKRGTLA